MEKVAGTENTHHPLELVLLKHGVERHIGEDEVVQHGDAQELACALEAFGDIAVVRAWHKVPAGVVVGDDDGGGPLTQGVGENLRLTVVDDTIRLFHGRGAEGCIMQLLVSSSFHERLTHRKSIQVNLLDPV